MPRLKRKSSQVIAYAHKKRKQQQVAETNGLQQQEEDRAVPEEDEAQPDHQTDYHYLVDYTTQMINQAIKFDKLVSEIVTVNCETCLRSSPELKLVNQSCNNCRARNGIGRFKFSANNNMNPGDVPPVLQRLTYIEQMLIAQIHPVVSLYRIKGQQWKYSGNCISFRQNIESFTRELPIPPRDLSSTIIFSKETPTGLVEFRANRERVHKALLWLKANNEYYKSITISDVNLRGIPVDGDMTQHLTTLVDNDPRAAPEAEGIQESFLAENYVSNNEEHIRKYLNLPYPTTDKKPINEFRVEGFIACAFPTLFPTGAADLNQARKMKLTVREYFQFLMQYRDRRFVTDTRFRFYALNMIMRHEALTLMGVYMKKSISAPQNVNEIRCRLKENPSFINQFMTFGAHIRSSKPYWFKRSRELLTMAEQIGMPTVFLTLSAADYHWPDLFRFIDENADINSLDEKKRRDMMHNNPDKVAYFFRKRCDIFIQHILKKLFHVTDLWYRYEWQWRGSSHLHGLFWFEGAPDLDKISLTNEEIEIIRQYFDHLCTAINPNINLPPAVIHPSRKRFSDVSYDCRLQDLNEIINRFQRHTEHGPYCLRKSKNGINFCRFKFPIAVRAESVVERTDKGRLEFHPKRNDDRVNKFNSFIAQVWRANHDVSAVIDKHAVLQYIAKYASKSEKCSTSYTDLMNELIPKKDGETSAKKIFSNFLISSFSERDYSAQEVMHLLNGDNLYSSSRTFCTLCLYENEEESHPIHVNEDETVSVEKTLIEKYRSRNLLYHQLSLFHFAKRYHFRGKKMVTRQKEAVVITVPKLKPNGSNGTPESDEKYYRQQIILHVPFHGHFQFDNFLNFGDVRHKTWKSKFDSEKLVPEDIQQIPKVDCEEEGDGPAYADLLNQPHIDPFAVQAAQVNFQPARVISQSVGIREVDLAHEWTRDSQALPSKEDVEHFLKTYKQTPIVDESFDFDANHVLSAEQNDVLDICKEQIKYLLTKRGNPPRKVAVQGKAGCGKSTVIKAIFNQVREAFGNNKSVCICAYTGAAALNVKGMTIHSLFNIAITRNTALSGEGLMKLQTTMKDTNFIIIDEMSMISQRLFHLIDTRCREAKANANTPFGGMMIYLFGDFRQLPPVKGTAMYDTNSKSDDIRGKLAFAAFDRFIELNYCHRQGGEDSLAFRTLLDNISNGCVNQ